MNTPKFKKGDKLRYKGAMIDLTFEVVALKYGKYVLKSSKGEELCVDDFNVHEDLELVE